MADQQRLSASMADGTEDVQDQWRVITADGVVTPCEMADFGARLQELVTVAANVDEAIGLTVTMLRRGPDSPSLKRRLRSRELRLVVINDGPMSAA